MLRRLFEDERKPDGTPVGNRYLFDGLAISQCGETDLKHQQQYPVISRESIFTGRNNLKINSVMNDS